MQECVVQKAPQFQRETDLSRRCLRWDKELQSRGQGTPLKYGKVIQGYKQAAFTTSQNQRIAQAGKDLKDNRSPTTT